MTETANTVDTFDTDDSAEIEDISFGKEIAKTLALSAATTAGMIVGGMVIVYATQKVTEFKQSRRVKKAAKAATIDVSDKTPANEK